MSGMGGMDGDSGYSVSPDRNTRRGNVLPYHQSSNGSCCCLCQSVFKLWKRVMCREYDKRDMSRAEYGKEVINKKLGEDDEGSSDVG